MFSIVSQTLEESRTQVRLSSKRTAFNGTTITYDNSGNPLSYNNGSAYTFTWDGRELESVVKGGVETRYTHGADGLRTQKQYGSTTYNWYEEYVAVGYVPEEGLEALEPPKMIEEIRKPTLLPLGVEEEIGIKSKSMFVCDYYVGDECYLSFKQTLIDDASKLDSDDATMIRIMIGDHVAWLFTYETEEYAYILWNDTQYAYVISSNILDIDTLISIAESVKY